MLKLQKMKDAMIELLWVDKLKDIFTYPDEMLEATSEWISGNDCGEIFYITLDDYIIGITGWYKTSIDNMFGLRWTGILPEYRGHGYCMQAVKMMYLHIAEQTKQWPRLFEIANTEETAKYFEHNKFIRVEKEETIKNIIESGGEIGDSIVLEFNASGLDIESIGTAIKSIYGVGMERNIDRYGDGTRNYGAMGHNIIYLSPFDDEDLEITAAFHELGHKISEDLFFTKGMKCYYVSTISKEGSAWEIGFNEMAKAGFKLDYDSKQYQFARKCMSSYIGGEYDDVTILNETLKEHTLRHKIDMRLEEAWRKK